MIIITKPPPQPTTARGRLRHVAMGLRSLMTVTARKP